MEDARYTAWNGIRFKAPGKYEIAEMGKRYLRLAHEGQTALEIRWEPVGKSFSLEKHARKFAKGFSSKRQEFCRFDSDSALATPSRTIYEWQIGSRSGTGALIHDYESGLAVMVQLEDGIPAQIDLIDFLDNLETSFESSIPYSAFGFSVSIPSALVLERYTFNPGLIRLIFKHKDLEITVERLGPANILLGESNLSGWVEKHAANQIDEFRLRPLATNDDLVKLEQVNTPDIWKRILSKIRRLPSFACMAAMHDEQSNRLVTVQATASRHIDTELIDMISKEVENVW